MAPINVLGNLNPVPIIPDLDYIVECPYVYATHYDLYQPTQTLGKIEVSLSLDECEHEPVNIGVMSEKWVCKRCDTDLSQKDLDKFFGKK